MHGRIIKLTHDARTGIVISEDGRHYRFCAADIVNMPANLVGHNADFLVREGRAVEIIVMCGTPFTVFGAPGPIQMPAPLRQPGLQHAA